MEPLKHIDQKEIDDLLTDEIGHLMRKISFLRQRKCPYVVINFRLQWKHYF
jgi:hypothetical protein